MKQSLFQLRIDDETLGLLRELAAMRDRSAAAIVREAIREKAARERPAASVLEFGISQKPGIESPDGLSFEVRPENKSKVQELLGKAKLRSQGLAVD